jgi:hypothetical protein
MKRILPAVAFAVLVGALARTATAGQPPGELYTHITFSGGGLTGQGVLDGYLSNSEFQIVSARGVFDSLPFTLTPSPPPPGTQVGPFDNILYAGAGGYAGTGFPFDMYGLGLTTSQFTFQLACGSISYETPTCEMLGPYPYFGDHGFYLLNFAYTPFAPLSAPEPTTLSLLCLGLAAAGLVRLRRMPSNPLRRAYLPGAVTR